MARPYSFANRWLHELSFSTHIQLTHFVLISLYLSAECTSKPKTLRFQTQLTNLNVSDSNRWTPCPRSVSSRHFAPLSAAICSVGGSSSEGAIWPAKQTRWLVMALAILHVASVWGIDTAATESRLTIAWLPASTIFWRGTICQRKVMVNTIA